jgi:hypothetical protein
MAPGGIGEQTRKLFEVCRLRDVPIITFVSKLDREGRDPFDLLDEIEQSLALDVTRPPGRSAWGATLSAPMTSSPMRSYCSSAASTTGSSSRAAAAVSTIRSCGGCRRNTVRFARYASLCLFASFPYSYLLGPTEIVGVSGGCCIVVACIVRNWPIRTKFFWDTSSWASIEYHFSPSE